MERRGRRSQRRVCPEAAPATDEEMQDRAPEPGGAAQPAESECRTTFRLMNRGRSRAAVYLPMPPESEGADWVAYQAITTRRLKLQLRDASKAGLRRWAGRPVSVSLRYEEGGEAVLSASGAADGGDGGSDLPLALHEGPGPGDGSRAREVRLTIGPGGQSLESFAILAPSHRHECRRFELVLASDGGPPVAGRILAYTRTHALAAHRPPRSASPAVAAAAPARHPRSAGELQAPSKRSTPKRVRRGHPRAEARDGTPSPPSSLSASSGEMPGAVPFKQEELDADVSSRVLDSANWGGSASSSDSDLALGSSDEDGGVRPFAPLASAAAVRAVPLPPAPRDKPPVRATINSWFVLPSDRPSLPHDPPPMPDSPSGLDILDSAIGILEANFEHIKSLSLEDREEAQAPCTPPPPPGSAPGQWLSAEDAWRIVPWGPPASGPPRPAQPRVSAEEAAALAAEFAAAAAPGALCSPAATLRLVAVLREARLLATPLGTTAEGRHALRRALHDLRAAGAYRAVGVVMESLAAAAVAMPEELACRADAEAAVDVLFGLLTASTAELSITFADLAYLPWPTASQLLRKAAAIAEPWVQTDPSLRCRIMFQRSMTLFHHGFSESALEEAFACWSELIRCQLTPSRLEAAVLRHIAELLLYVGKIEQARHMATRLYFFDSPAPADLFLKASVLHLLSMIESSVNKRLEDAISLVTRAIETFEGLPDAYRAYAPRSVGCRAILYSSTRRIVAANRDLKSNVAGLAATAEAWSVQWSCWHLLRHWWWHPPEASAELARVYPPLRRLLRTMELHAFAVRILDPGLATPMRANVLFELGHAYLLAGNSGKARSTLERAREAYAGSVPLHFPPDCGRMRSIARGIEEAEWRAAGGAPRDVFGFSARRLPASLPVPPSRFSPASSPSPPSPALSTPAHTPPMPLY